MLIQPLCGVYGATLWNKKTKQGYFAIAPTRTEVIGKIIKLLK